jgi:hypothetical protein
MMKPNLKLAIFCTSIFCGLLVLLVGMSIGPAEAQLSSQTLACNASNGSGGLAAGWHDVTVAGQPAIVVVSDNYDPATPTLLTFHLHGDGGGYNDFWAQSGQAINQLVQTNNWIYVSPQAPYQDPDSGVIRWWGDGVGSSTSSNAGIEANAQLLENVFEEMFSKYNLCRDVLLGQTVSGGSWFYTGYFVPSRGDQYPAFTNINCGSSFINNSWANWFPPYDHFLSFKSNTAIQNRTQMHYTIGTDDFLYPDAEISIPFYKGHGFNVTSDILPDVGHCAFDIAAKTIAYWTAVNNSLIITTGPTTGPTATPTATPTTGPPPVLDKFTYLPFVVKD